MKTIDINQLVRKNILALHPYSSARDEFKGDAAIFLDANENPFGILNRYPDPYQKKLKQALSVLKQMLTEQIFIGNGSDEVIDLVYRIFCEPGKDKALTFSPTYGMYEVSANINDVTLIKIPLTAEFQPDLNLLEPQLHDQHLKVIFICSPNNPTGNNFDHIETILQQFDGIVVVDEAYIDFSERASLINLVAQYNNLIVSQTFSKARGLAAARVGVAFANEAIITWMNKVKPPYNVSALNQQAALDALEQSAAYETQKKTLLEEREKMVVALKRIPLIKKVYPSAANFLLAEVSDANKIYAALTNKKIVVRNRHSVIQNCLRITVGTPEENQQLIQELQFLQV
jgi:histidinol-phosphate aminotransferase